MSDPVSTTSPQNNTRLLIIETATAHLRRFGESKMTIVDIARDLGMSHANVYRFFGSKSEIIDAVIDRWLSKVEAFVGAIADRALPAGDRLEAVVLELHRKMRDKLQNDAEVYESFRRVMESRPDAVAKRQGKIGSVFKRIVADGLKSGEFRGIDAAEAAEALTDATAVFLHPLIMPAALSDQTEARAKRLVRFIVAGFASTEN